MKLLFKINLPHPPQSVLDEVIDIGNNRYADADLRQHIVGYAGDTDFGNDPFDRRNKRRRLLDVDKGIYARTKPTDELKEFIYSILPDYGLTDDRIGIQTTINRHFPHTDKLYARLMYRVSGDACVTTWFIEEGQELIRKSGIGFLEYDTPTLKPIESGVLNNGNWYLVISNVIHGVMNNKGKRISITVPMEEWQANKLISEHNTEE